MWGPSTGAASCFSGRPFLVITVRVSGVSSPQKLATFFVFAHHSRFTRGSPIISGMQKNAAPFVGAPFLWGPCSAEHAEHA